MIVNDINVAILNAFVDKIVDCRTVKGQIGGPNVDDLATFEERGRYPPFLG